MPGTLHEALVDILCAQTGAQRKGFRKALRKQFSQCGPDRELWPPLTDDDDDDDDGCQHSPMCDPAITDALMARRVVPDAYQIDAKRLIIRAFEVDVTSVLDDQRIEAYTDLWWAFDAGEWSFELVCIDRYGTSHAVDLATMAFGLLKGASACESVPSSTGS